jgi:VIT1/CCC1 family predicted Fe2+/Mn2+ transporter
VEKRSFRQYPQEERAELVAMLTEMGLTPQTAAKATEELHRDEHKAMNFHLVQELGVDPREKPSPWVAAFSSFFLFAIGAVIPLIPYLLGYASLWAGLSCGVVGLMLVGGAAARFTRKPKVWAASRQLLLGGVAVAVTYLVGYLIGVSVT